MAVASAAQLQYGLVDLEAGSDLGAAPAIETDDAAVGHGRKSAPKQRRAPATVKAGTLPSPAERSRSGAKVRSGSGKAGAAVNAGSYGTGVMLDDNPFNDAFGGGAADLPSLEIEGRSEPAPAASESALPSLLPESSIPEAKEESEGERRARQIREIAGYGISPARPIAAPLYCVRVTLRKRVLMEALLALSAQRKRSDDQAQAALAQLGEALFAMRGDTRLAGLSKQLKIVVGAEERVGDIQAKDQKRQQSGEQELARIERELSACERDAAPLRDHQANAEMQIEELKAHMRRVEMQRRKADGELETLLRAKPASDPDRVAALRAERDARHGELQTLGIQTRPLEDDLAAARRELAQHMRAVAVLQSEKQAVVTALGRAQQTHRVSVGSARDGRMQALTTLANAGLKLGLGALVPDAERAAYEAAQRAHQKRSEEELHRAAVASFDQKAYSNGLMMLLGGSGLLFLTLALMILL